MRLNLVLTIILISAIIFAGCVGEKSPESTKTTTPKTSEEGKVKLKIGVLIPKTGSFQSAGVFMENAVRLAEKHAEEKYKVDIELEFADCGDSAEKTKSAFLELVNKGVDVVIGAYSSTQAISASETANQTSKLYIATVASTEKIEKMVLDGNKYVFRNSYNTTYWGELAGIFLEISGAEGYYFQGYQPLSTFNQGMLDVIKKKTGVNPMEVSYYNPSADPNDVANKAVKAVDVVRDRDVLILGDPGPLAVSFLKEYRQKGGKGIIYSVGGVLALPQTLQNLGEIAHYTAFQSASLENVKTTEFTEMYFSDYRKEYGEDANNYAGVLTYDALLILAQAVEKAGKSTDDLIKELEQDEFEGACGIYKFNSAHQAMWGSEKLKGKIAEWVGKVVVLYPESAKESAIVWQ